MSDETHTHKVYKDNVVVGYAMYSNTWGLDLSSDKVNDPDSIALDISFAVSVLSQLPQLLSKQNLSISERIIKSSIINFELLYKRLSISS